MKRGYSSSWQRGTSSLPQDARRIRVLIHRRDRPFAWMTVFGFETIRYIGCVKVHRTLRRGGPQKDTRSSVGMLAFFLLKAVGAHLRRVVFRHCALYWCSGCHAKSSANHPSVNARGVPRTNGRQRTLTNTSNGRENQQSHPRLPCCHFSVEEAGVRHRGAC